MIYRLYNDKTHKYATTEEYKELAVNNMGYVVKLSSTSDQNDTLSLIEVADWAIQYGFINSKGEVYYQNDIFISDSAEEKIVFDGVSFSKKLTTKSTFYDVNYGGYRHHSSLYPVNMYKSVW